MHTTVRASDIATLLDGLPASVTTLSLDCFDTLIWRAVHAPVDIFTRLPLDGGGVEPRMRAEKIARDIVKQAGGYGEVTIDDIYAQLMPRASDDERAAAVAHELAEEARHCFAFAPVVALIEAAKAAGKRVIIVSDTYLSEPQLRTLIADVAGNAVAAAIDRIFCSCEHGASKGDGLFETVLAALGCPPASIVHLGDNLNADAKAPIRSGIRAVHFEQFASEAVQRLRLEAAAAALIDPATRVTRATMQSHRAQISLRDDCGPAAALGHDVLGPVLHGFAHWLRGEADALTTQTGRPVKLLFMLRDGFLPQRAFEAAGLGDAAAIEISRFTARRASFTDEAAIRTYLREDETDRVDVLARQLNLEAGEAARFGRDATAFRAAMVEPRWVQRICARSAQFAKRMAEHVRVAADVRPGECLMIIDLGYNGTVQNLAEDVLAERLGVTIAGRYLLLREHVPTGRDKRGFIDLRHFDTRAVNALCRSIAVIEQLATAAQGSVTDYRPNGHPMRGKSGMKGAQSEVRSAVQAACIDYVAQAGAGAHRPAAVMDDGASPHMAAAILARLMFLPQAGEVALLERFDHDVNLGTDDTVRMMDPDAARTGLRQRGLPYLSGAKRMFLPGEIHANGLPLALSLLSLDRFALDLRNADFRVGGIEVPVLLADDRSQTISSVTAYPTHDGYYLLSVPARAGGFAIGLQLGAIAEMVQIDMLAFHPVQGFMEGTVHSRSVPVQPVYDDMEAVAPGVLRAGEAGLVFVSPPQGDIGEPVMLACAFRPIVPRVTAAQQKMAA